jgi:hypothetical protein
MSLQEPFLGPDLAEHERKLARDASIRQVNVPDPAIYQLGPARYRLSLAARDESNGDAANRKVLPHEVPVPDDEDGDEELQRRGRKARKAIIDELDLPCCAIDEQTRDHFIEHGISGERTSMADYCGPCHKFATEACFTLIVSEAIGVFLGWVSPFTWLNLLVLQPFTIGVVVLEWKCLTRVLLPWQAKLLENGSAIFRLPLISTFYECGFCEWAVGVSIVSVVVCVSLQNQAVHTGGVFRSDCKSISVLCFLASFASLFWAVLWSWPRHHVRWEFDRDREPENANQEYRFETLASHIGLCQGCTHYESLIRYAQPAGMFGLQQMTNSLPHAESCLLWYASDDFERKCLERLQMVMRFSCAMVAYRVLLRTVPQVCLSTMLYHNNWQSWWALVPLGVNLLQFVLSDMTTYITTEGFYAELTSMLLSDRDERDYTGECGELIRSSRRWRKSRWPLMGVSVSLILFCVSLVLADQMCRPFLVSDFKCKAHQDKHGAAFVVLLVVFFIVVGAFSVLFWYIIREPMFEPSPRKNQKKLYVDEDATPPQYYWHKEFETSVMSISDGNKIFQHLGAAENNSRLNVERGRQFRDTKLLRVQERGQQNDLPPCNTVRKEFLRTLAVRDNWLELACRFGKELTLSEWTQGVRKNPKRKMVKLLGFDGHKAMLTTLGNRATQQLMGYDVVVWDGDWYNNEGWTGMIHTFLLGNPQGTAVAFQKKAEVPGFHRSYWELYKTFPNRIQIVVLNDDVMNGRNVCPQILQEQYDRLKTLWDSRQIEEPSTMKYLNVALLQRRFQRQFQCEIPVIAMNGGTISTAMAALETDVAGPHGFRRIQWTVYEVRTKVDQDMQRTLFYYALNRQNEYLKVVRMAQSSSGTSEVQRHHSMSPGGRSLLSIEEAGRFE